LFVGCHDTIYVHRVSDFGVLRRIPVRGRASRLVVESVSGYVYVLDPGSVSRVLGIRAQDYVVTCSLIVNAEARDIEVVPGRSLLLVPDRQKNTVQVRTLSDFGLVATVPVCSYPDEIEVLPDGSLAYAAGAEGFGVAVVRTTDWTVRRMLPIEPGAGSICAMPGSRHAFLAAWSFSGVVVLSTLNDSVVASIESPACGFVRVSPDGRCLVTTDCDSQLDIIGFGQSQAP
jgi:DNA-binding beta-propeller fold protein YncE